ncbi:putative cytoplasmic protein [Acinetobacter baumannii]|uniref:winged helix-turn-helix domain-containing protein n=2 Tax=Acinetobacter baumannii TaxID=470 RepID=UPI0002B9A617|nr:crosslink repair DNA glycosylase YcaQ family protein [Acinetobacter baumannii]MCO9027558.1 winged helix DNA-binding domain-containing protein [Acinetobacter baumannii]MCT9339244.1 winged helix DNA-binding domain-containing protein [Acinetobacter baumannii]MCX3036216.1 winged helix DNA-binding domain-containing protein [Acinetobacter baumannii]MDC4453700.1 winged helix DNA-binding domain-containing protein [Acinetobacter baumannii]MDC5445545.1 winged helix DNA-binding domain-containing prote
MISSLKKIALLKQGLGKNSPFAAGRQGTLEAIEHLGYVQIDTISVVERAHHHILWSRVPNYDLSHLNSLVRERQIFEYWYHAASYLPMKDYRYALPAMMSVRKGESRYFNRGDQRLMNEILARVRAEGKIRLRDIDKKNKESLGNWWNTGPGRRAFEQLYMQGDLMICERNGMEKVYDLTERCLPENIDLSLPTLYEYAQYLFNNTLRAHGAFTWKQLVHLKKNDLKETMRVVLKEQIDAGVVSAIKLADGQTLYVDVTAIEQQLDTDFGLKILSPFDNSLIHRDRLTSLFEFDYRIECYVPAAKRVFGYFCLPILYQNELVGRVDCKAHRTVKELEVISLHLEKTVKDKEHFFFELDQELKRFAAFNQCSTVNDKVVKLICSKL